MRLLRTRLPKIPPPTNNEDADRPIAHRTGAIGHNRRAFDTLVRKYQSQVRRFFLHQTLGNEFLSDDLAQETFIRAWLGLGSFRGLSDFSTWLLRIAYNVHYDYLRNRKETTGLNSLPPGGEGMCEQPPLDAHVDLYQALALLRPDERTCMTLFYMEDLTIAKIASVTGLPEGTVKSHLSRGKAKLSNYLKQHGYESA